MTVHYYLVYKEHYTDTRHELRFYDTWEGVLNAAARMIDQFKYWGGGPVPVSADSSKWTAAGKYAGEKYDSIEYPEALYIEYARENGTKYGYYNDMHRHTAQPAA